MNDVALVAVRWALYVDLGLLFGLPLFALYAPGGGRMVQRHLPMAAMVAGLACLALLLSALGFALQAAAMTGLPLAQPDLSMVAELFNGTSMGTALKARLVALLVLLLSIPFYRRQSRPAFIASTLAGAVALATLAWSGHGAAGEGEAGWLQLGADLIHLLAAGAWWVLRQPFFPIAGIKVDGEVTHNNGSCSPRKRCGASPSSARSSSPC